MTAVARGAPKSTVMATRVTSMTPSPPGVKGMALAMFAAAIGDRQWPEPGLVPEGKEHQIEREQVEQQVGRGEPVAFEERPAGQRGPGGHHEPLAGLGCLLWVNAGPDVPCPPARCRTGRSRRPWTPGWSGRAPHRS